MCKYNDVANSENSCTGRVILQFMLCIASIEVVGGWSRAHPARARVGSGDETSGGLSLSF